MNKISVKSISIGCIMIISILISLAFSNVTLAQEEKLTIEKSIESGDLIIANANVKDFGAIGNGEIDDTDAFNTAITFVYNMGGESFSFRMEDIE